MEFYTVIPNHYRAEQMRLKKGFTQEQVARAANIKPDRYRRFEAGEYRLHHNTYTRVLEVLECAERRVLPLHK